MKFLPRPGGFPAALTPAQTIPGVCRICLGHTMRPASILPGPENIEGHPGSVPKTTMTNSARSNPALCTGSTACTRQRPAGGLGRAKNTRILIAAAHSPTEGIKGIPCLDMGCVRVKACVIMSYGDPLGGAGRRMSVKERLFDCVVFMRSFDSWSPSASAGCLDNEGVRHGAR